MKLKECVKRAITRIIIDLINADGIVDENEIEYIATLKKKYQLTAINFIDAKKISLADAINTIIKSEKLTKQELCPMFSKDIEQLVSIDGTVSPNEAMICLAFRYALDFPNAHVFKYEHHRIRFSKKEVIFIDSQQTDETNKLYDEIYEYYDNISAIFASYGFNFVFIPQIKEEFISLNPDRLKQIIEYFYPAKHSKTYLDDFYQAMMQVDTFQFSSWILKSVLEITSIPPSLLFKISSSTIELDGKRKKVDNFLQLPVINNTYTLQRTIQNFSRKYSQLIKENRIQIIRKSNTQFNMHGFHKTFLDINIELVEKMTAINLLLRKRRKDADGKIIQTSIRFGTHEISMSIKELSYYLLIIYLKKSNNTPLKEMDKNQSDREWIKFEYYYRIIYSSICKLGREKRCEECINKLCKSFKSKDYLDDSFHHICEKFRRYVYLKRVDDFLPIRIKNRDGDIYSINFPEQIKVIDTQNKNKEIDFVEWVNLQTEQNKI